MPEPICFSEPLLSQNDAVTSEQNDAVTSEKNAKALPLARFEKEPQVAYC